MVDEQLLNQVRLKFDLLAYIMDERLRCLWGAAEALVLGRGGKAAVARIVECSQMTLARGQSELERPLGERPAILHRVRRRRLRDRRRVLERDSRLLAAIDALIKPRPKDRTVNSFLRWTTDSLEVLAEKIKPGKGKGKGQRIRPRRLAGILHQQGFTLSGRRKPRLRISDRRRVAQFTHVDRRVRESFDQETPALYVTVRVKDLSSGRGFKPPRWH